MSRGLGWVQQACLRVIREYEEDDSNKLPTTYDFVGAVYQIDPDEDGACWINDAQHVAVKRALEGLQRSGRIIGFRTQRARSRWDGNTELCYHWMSETRAQKFVTDTLRDARDARRLGGNDEFLTALAECVMRKMRAIRMHAR